MRGAPTINRVAISYNLEQLYYTTSHSPKRQRTLVWTYCVKQFAEKPTTMAEQPQANALASLFPTPPPFWQSFTTENTTQIEELRAEHAGPNYTPNDPATSLPIRLLDLPPELRLLQPPEPPKDGVYRCFGDTYNVRIYWEHT